MIIPLWVGLGGSKEHGNTLVFPKPHFKNVPWKKIDKKRNISECNCYTRSPRERWKLTVIMRLAALVLDPLEPPPKTGRDLR